MKINFVGLGNVGLPTALLLASSGYEVIGTDSNNRLLMDLKNGKYRTGDSELDLLLATNCNNNLSYSKKVVCADYHFIAVPTPYIKSSKKIDLNSIYDVLIKITSLKQEDFVVVIESTISPGTVSKLKSKFTDKKISFIHSPERILPGNTFYELVHNSRTIGSDDPILGKEVEELYKGFCIGDIIHTDIITAELSKVAENTFRDINIALANEFAIISHEMGVDVYELISIANMHPRVNILNPGPGVGGHCIPVDPWFLVGDYPNLTKLIRSAREVNDYMPHYVFERAAEIIRTNNIDLSRIGVYGLTYKADVMDTRESPSLTFIELLTKQFVAPIIYDPMLKEDSYPFQVTFEDFLLNTDFIVVMVDHTHLKMNVNKLTGKTIFDTKRVVFLDGVIRL
jgi:UDP-N-acetyl-D-mannosaminuronic acid dehydrogenase